MKIGELSETTGVSVPTIRLYEREGLISLADRTDGRFRIFNDQQKQRLEFIKRVRDLGFSLDDVKGLLALSELKDPHQDREFMDRVLSATARRLGDLTQLQDRLQKARDGRASCEEIITAFRPAGG